MNSAQLGIFIVLAETLSFSKTAGILYVSQSHVSKQISKLEDEWNVQLFERDHHNVTLTPAGRLMYEYWQNSQQSLVSAIRAAQNLGDSIEMKLQIGISSSVNYRRVPEAIRSLREKHPNALVSLNFAPENQLMLGLFDGTYDLIITNRDAVNHWPSVSFQELRTGTYYICVSIDEQPAIELPALLNGLKDKQLITVSNSADMSTNVLLDKLHLRYGYTPGHRTDAPNLEACYSMVESGMGYAFVENIPSNTPLVPRLSFTNTGVAYSVGAVHKSDSSNFLAEAFIQILKGPYRPL